MRITLGIAQQILDSGGIVAVPTETVYGLAAKLSNPNAIDNIFKIKGRPNNNPLIIHLETKDQIHPFVLSTPIGFELLAQNFWPGPLTMVLPIQTDTIPSNVRAGLPTAAFRIPEHPLALELMKHCGPLVMPSANLSGKPSATSPKHVENDFGSDFPVLDGGQCQKGVESTIVIFDDQWQIARLGAIPPESLERVLGYPLKIASKSNGTPICPGQLYRHYAPKARLHLTHTFSDQLHEVVVGYSDVKYPPFYKVFALGPKSSPQKIAENLYAVLRKLDENNIAAAYIDMNIPQEGLWSTIAERLQRAQSSQRNG